MHSSGFGPRFGFTDKLPDCGGLRAELHLPLTAGGANYLLELHTGETGLPASLKERWGEIKF